MNTTVMTSEKNEEPMKSMIADEFMFFVKAAVSMSALVLFLASAWV